MHTRDLSGRAARYNIAMLEQALAVLDWFGAEACADRYGGGIGPHLRHVLEHYEQFFEGLKGRVIDYDARRRDAAVEKDVTVAHARVAAMIERLSRFALSETVPDTIAVMLCGGLDGADRFVTTSTPARELLFLASHAVHHYAIIKPLLTKSGYPLSRDFGKAPATIRYERAHAGVS